MGENRVYFRVSFEKPLQFKICSLDLLSDLHVASSRNVSQSGICFASKTNPPLGTILMIQADLKTLANCIRIENHLFELEGCVLGKVIWTLPSRQKDGLYDVGVSFIKTQDAESFEVQQAVALLS